MAAHGEAGDGDVCGWDAKLETGYAMSASLYGLYLSNSVDIRGYGIVFETRRCARAEQTSSIFARLEAEGVLLSHGSGICAYDQGW